MMILNPESIRTTQDFQAVIALAAKYRIRERGGQLVAFRPSVNNQLVLDLEVA